MRANRPRRPVGAVVFGLVALTGCSSGTSESVPTTIPTTTSVAPGEVSVWECQDGRRLRLEGTAGWGYEGSPLNPGGTDDRRFTAELFRCHGVPLGGNRPSEPPSTGAG